MNTRQYSTKQKLPGVLLYKEKLRLIFVIQATTLLQDYRSACYSKVPRTHIFTDPQVPGMDSCISKTSAWPPTREERHRG